jgi:hypothetical protein
MNYFSILGSAESNASDFVPTKLKRETTMLKKLPTIPQGKVADGSIYF